MRLMVDKSKNHYIHTKEEMKSQKQNILILDGGHKKTLGILRMLGKKRKYQIDVAAYNKRAICFFSRYKGHKIVLPDPRARGEDFKDALIKILKIKAYLAVIPTDYHTFRLCSEIKQEINTISYVMIGDPEQLAVAGDKYQVATIAEAIGIPTPKSTLLTKDSSLDELDLGEECVLKSPEESSDQFLNYLRKSDDPAKIINQYFEEHPDRQMLAQEKIKGDGYGFFAIYDEGKCLNSFVHHRIREYPPSGGYSVAAEGVRNDRITEYGTKILDHLKWHGVAMVEFKHNMTDDDYYILEINPKFWGSIELAMRSGVDFVQMWIDHASEKPIERIERYDLIKFQWLINGELFHVLERPKNIGAILRDLLYSKTDLWISDLLPNLYQIANVPVHYFKKWFR